MAYNIFERWPWTSFQNLNLDWILRKMKEAVEKANEASENVGSFDDRITQNSNDIAQLLLDVESIARPLRIFVNSNLEVLHAAYPMTGGEIYDLIAGKEYLPFIEYLNEYYMLADIQTNALVFQKLHIPTIGNPYIKILTIPLTGSRAGYTIKEWTGGGGGGGSDDIRIVKITATNGGYTSDTAYAQIIAAMNAGQHIAMKLLSGGNVIMETATVFLYGNNNNIVFINPQSFLNTNGQMNAIGMNAQNVVYSITGPQYITADSFLNNYLPRLLPVVSATDNGKFLRVVEGVWEPEAGDEYSALPSDTASGPIASFPDGADEAPVKSLVARIAPVQSGSGNPSPTNIRPISGWTSVTVTRTGADNQRKTYTIAFLSEAGTVYGGTLDVTNGVLTVDSEIVDMGTLNWMYNPNRQRMVAQVDSAKPAGSNVGLDGACSVYKVIKTGYQSAPDKSIVIGNNFISQSYAAMVVHDDDYTDAATFKTAVSGQTLVYPIKNPVTYQLDPVTVTTLLGMNNIWADTGEVAVEYRADIGLYIQKLTGSTEEDMIADAPIASGKYFLVGNTLYLSTAEIAAGATLTPGTNCVKTNLAEALNALNS